MKLWQILQIVLITSLVGCVAEPIQLPKFETAERQNVEVTDPVDLPDLCGVPWTATECWQRIDVFEDVAIGNTELAELNADIARDSDAAYDHILSGAVQQQEIGQIRQEMLEAERRDHFIDNLERGIVIVLLGIGLVL